MLATSCLNAKCTRYKSFAHQMLISKSSSKPTHSFSYHKIRRFTTMLISERQHITKSAQKFSYDLRKDQKQVLKFPSAKTRTCVAGKSWYLSAVGIFCSSFQRRMLSEPSERRPRNGQQSPAKARSVLHAVALANQLLMTFESKPNSKQGFQNAPVSTCVAYVGK